MQEQKAKFTISDLLPVALTIVVAAIGVAFGLQIMGDIRDDYVTGAAGCNSTTVTGCGYDYNATVDGITATAKFPEKLGIIVTVIVAALLIGILTRFLMNR